jgi:hypothetical protein
MKCYGCGKEVYGEAPFEFEQHVYHVDVCLSKAIKLSRRNALKRKNEREQRKLVRWN